ncbi:S-adenosylmethionine tRNA ribosyltransferase [Lysobacteraceae bacterium NML93-0399]|nr:S-adenosylmethionine tRNA ribosyltransferase [Xanthomonadaceae bacterium NML93-0399]
MSGTEARIAAEIRTLLAARAPDASICPSEVARRLCASDHWRDAMPDVRRVARALAADGLLRITQGDTVLDPADNAAPGPIRLRRGPQWRAT